MKATERLTYISSVLQNERFSERERLKIIKNIATKEFDEIRFPKYSIEEIEKQVVSHLGISLDRMNSELRVKEVVLARQFAHYKARKFTIEPLEYIGMYFGKKDHATVLHSNKTIEGYLEVDKQFREEHEEFLNN